jgi:hypothetical protein
VPQPQEEGAPVPAVSRDGSGDDMTHHDDGSGGSSGDGGRDGGDGGSGEQSGGGD